MPNFNTIKKTVKNKKGKKVYTEYKMTAKKKDGTISISEVNRLYKKLLEKYDAEDIIIKGLAPDKWTTIKSQQYIEDDLKFILQNYYRSFGIETSEVEKKFARFYELNIFIME